MKAKELRAIRDKLSWTQAMMAEKVGVAANTLARYERAELKIPEPVARLVLLISKTGRKGTSNE